MGDGMTRTKVYLIIQTILCIMIAGLLCAAAVRIYSEGTAVREGGEALAWIYTEERIMAFFAPIMPVIFCAIGMLMAGLIFGIRDKNSSKTVSDPEYVRNMMAARINEPTDVMKKEQRLRKYFRAGSWACFGLCMVPVFIYVIDPQHFPADQLELMISSLFWNILPWTAAGLGFVLLGSVLRDRSLKREIQDIKNMQTDSVHASTKSIRNNRLTVCIQVAVLIASVCLIIAGISNGGMRDVFVKAINICTECIGLG